MTSSEPTQGRCNAKTRDGGYCEAWPVSGRPRCRMHGGTSPKGREAANYKHGAYSKYMRHDLTEEEAAAFEDLVGALDDPEQALATVKELAAEALIKYKRSGDTQFLREYRQIADTFNFAPNEQALSVAVNGDPSEAYVESLKQRLDGE